MTGSSTAPSPRAELFELDQALRRFATPQRQSPMSLLFKSVKVIRNLQGFNLALFGAFFFARQLGPLILAGLLLGFAVVLAWSVVWWWKFVFYVEGDQLLVNKGVYAEERLAIPLDRIQSVSIDQPALHRLAGVVRASVDTAGSAAAEFQIDAIPESLARALQHIVESRGVESRGVESRAVESRAAESRGDESYDAESGGGGGAGVKFGDGSTSPQLDISVAEEVLLKRSFSELLKAAISRLPLAGVVGLGSLFPFMDRIVDRVESFNQNTSVAALLALGIIVLLLIWLLNIAQEVVRNWGLTVSKSRVGLRRSAGLFSRTSRSTTVERIQALTTSQNWVERFFGIRRLALPTIGEGNFHITGSSAVELARFRQLVFGNQLEVDAVHRVSSWIIYRDVRAVPLIAILSGAATVAFRTAWPLLGTVVIIWVIVRAVLNWRFFRWAMLDDRIVVTRSIFTRYRTERPLIKVQTAKVSSTFLERRRGLATLRLRYAEGQLALPMIERAEAERLRDFVLATLAIDRRPWM